jgi:thiamine-monophosphate kinase
MLIKDLGEFRLIERIKKLVKTDSSVIKGIGDDCSVIKFNKTHYLLYTCDMLVEGVDFVSKDKPYLIGRKALAVSISDIAACGGIPRYALVSLGIPKFASWESVNNIYKGMINLAKMYNINIVGGDISQAQKLTIDISMSGLVEKKYLVLRNGAKKGDIIFVSGNFGGSIVGKHLKFTPRLKEARFLVNNFKINSMIDVSDGLSQDLNHILKESKVGAIIYEDLIPLSKECRGIKDALCSGEDFELLFTLSLKEARRLLRKRDDFTPIGRIAQGKKGLRLVDKQGSVSRLKSLGFLHF